MDYKAELQEKLEYIEKILDHYLPVKEEFQEIIMDAMRYSVKAGGKRVRPLIMHETFLMFGGKTQIIEPFMAAMEMLHTYSLVHDDLPAMDNDEYRRGRKTTHIVYGEAIGVLAGDALLNYSYETAMKAFDLADTEVDFSIIVTALSTFMNKAGIYGMIGGQVADVLNEDIELNKSYLNFIYEMKTGALIEASFMMGAILAGADKRSIEIMQRIGHSVGMAFQIQDDVLDVVGDAKELGKSVHSDEKNNKTTYVSLYGLEAAKEAVEDYSNEALVLLQNLKDGGIIEDSEFLEEVISMLIHRTK